MARSQEEKARTHERILRIASKRLRETGLNGVGVADLMKEAGLTVGGFYKHFASRDDLVAEAIGASFGHWKAQEDMAGDDAAGAPNKAARWAALLNTYLDTAHRDQPGIGCAFGALASDLARADAKTRHCATEQLRRNFETLAGLLDDSADAPARGRAILAFSAMVGAVGLARLADDDALSREILETVRDFLARPTTP